MEKRSEKTSMSLRERTVPELISRIASYAKVPVFTGVLFGVAFYPAAQAQDLAPGKGGEIVNANCGGCHGLNRVTSAGKSKDDWQTAVDRMIGKGADVKVEEVAVVVTY